MSFLKITDPEKRDTMVHEYLMLRNKIRQDSLSEKLGDIDQHRELTKLYKPITDSQRELKEATSSAIQALPAALAATTPNAITFPQYPSIQAEEDKRPKETLIELGSIATEYLRSMAGKQLTDKTFGLYDKGGAFYIGDSEVKLSGDDIIVGETKYNGTLGLWELITSKYPDSDKYTSQDIDSYKTILLNTNAIVNPDTGKVKSSSGEKYRKIIKPIYEAYLKPKKTHKISSLFKKKGEGIALMPSDPNRLVEMLTLRVNSYNAGNTGVKNEIIDIADELVRQAVIDKEYYKKLMLRI